MKNFEAHITYAPDAAGLIKLRDFVKPDNGWHLSTIDGDPQLGTGTRCYLTAHSDNSVDLLMRMLEVVTKLGVPPMRMKIEHVIFDTKTGAFNL